MVIHAVHLKVAAHPVDLGEVLPIISIAVGIKGIGGHYQLSVGVMALIEGVFLNCGRCVSLADHPFKSWRVIEDTSGYGRHAATQRYSLEIGTRIECSFTNKENIIRHPEGRYS